MRRFFIKVTEFFRDPVCFEYLSKAILPKIIEGKKSNETVRVWVPGCATGEEVYSIAICLQELLESHPGKVSFEVFGTDISDIAIEGARAGEYISQIDQYVSNARLETFFQKTMRGFKVLPSIREKCIFARQNRLSDPPISKVDLISCRNVLIYFSQRVQRQVLETFHYALNPEGYLILGNSEDWGTAKWNFRVESNPHKVYSKVVHGLQAVRNSSMRENETISREIRVIDPDDNMPMDDELELNAQADHLIQSDFVPPGVVLDDALRVLQFRGDTSSFLKSPSETHTREILKLCSDELEPILGALLQRVQETGQSVKVQTRISGNGAHEILVITVLPFVRHPPLAEKQRRDCEENENQTRMYFVVLFSTIEGVASSQDMGSESVTELDRIRQELSQTRSYISSLRAKQQVVNEELRSANEELRSANEELRSANEEIHSANEELQSSNQELATAREESIAFNEELLNANQELRAKASELTSLTEDMGNLLGSLKIPIMIISEKLELKLFTNAAAELFNLKEGDPGKSIEELSTIPGLGMLDALSRKVDADFGTAQEEILAPDGHWYSMRARPYLTKERQVKGVVFTFYDVSDIKKSEQAMKSERDLSNTIILGSPNPLLILDSSANIVSTNRAFDALFEVDSQSYLGQALFKLWGAFWDSSRLRQLIDDDWQSTESIDEMVIDEYFPLRTQRYVMVSTSKVKSDDPALCRHVFSFTDVTFERTLRKEAEEARAAALAANQAKSDFLANMSHEMRSPLMAIMGYSESIGDHSLSQGEREEFANKIIRNSEDLIELIDEILDISKIEAGKLQMDPVEFDLTPLLQEVLGPLKCRALEANLAFEIEVEGQIPARIRSCPRRLRQILLNIIGNALKFTRAGGIQVRLFRQGPFLNFDVSDSGCGISLSSQTQLFQPFSQADSSVSRRFGGTGLGLSLSRSLAKALGGDVVLVESTLGKGSLFRISIDPGIVQSNQFLQLSDLREGLIHERPRSSAQFVSNARLRGKSILLVEDSPDNQAIIGLFLRNSGAEVTLASDGFRALDILKEQSFDLILMDVQMPGLDGYSVTRKLRERGCASPIVALTANAMLGEHDRALDAGCNAYISKPVRARCLIDAVERSLHESLGCC